MHHSRQTDFCWGAVIGGGVAVLTSLLFTTKKGRQIQRKIADVYDEFEETMREKFSNAKEQAEEAVNHVQKKVSHKHKEEEAK